MLEERCLDDSFCFRLWNSWLDKSKIELPASIRPVISFFTIFILLSGSEDKSLKSLFTLMILSFTLPVRVAIELEIITLVLVCKATEFTFLMF